MASLMGYRPKQGDSNPACIHKHLAESGKRIELEYRIFDDGELGEGFKSLSDAVLEAAPRKPGRPKKQVPE